MTQPSPRLTQGTRTQPAPPTIDLSMAQKMREQDPPQLPYGVAALPAPVQTQINRFWTALQAADNAYSTLGSGYNSIWESDQYPVEYRQGKAAEFMDALFAKQAADIQSAEVALKAAWDAVRAGLTPPIVGDATAHELKLMNAREEVKMAVDGLGPRDSLLALESLFDEAMDSGTSPGMVYFLAGTDSYKRVLRDGSARLDFAELQKGMLRRVLPLTADAYYAAEPILNELARKLTVAVGLRIFTAKDNGLALRDSTGRA